MTQVEPSADRIAVHLAGSDPVLKAIVASVGVSELPRIPGGFAGLARAIVFQQISGAAGASILRRLRVAHGRPGVPSPDWFLRASPGTLRKAGLSPQKRGYVQDLARHVRSGRLDFRRIHHLPDEAVIAALTDVKGIGRWTAQMYLIFALNRPDVLPTGDLGIRKAVQRGWGFTSLPAERTVERLGRGWAPYRSHASHYLWRSLSASR